MSQLDSVIIQVRGRLQELSIKLWLEPFYFDDIGSVEVKIDELAEEFSRDLGLSVENCKAALLDLQDRALEKLASRKEFNETGMATFTIRHVDNQHGTQNIFIIKCAISAFGSELQRMIAEHLNVNSKQVKCISGGKILDPDKTLDSQEIKTSQQFMVIIGQVDTSHSDPNEAMYDRINKIKMDVEAIVDSNRGLFEMEDQDGNPVFLPPQENRAMLMAMGYCEKARAAMKKQHYDEALILLLEADEKFTTCNSKFLESVDNYALVNLDIVWCYLCLKNVTQLPDAQRRLEICEKSFHRSYGENLSRLMTLKGNSSPERALIMRLHLLQGVVYFHQNRRNDSYNKLELAGNELRELKVNDNDVSILVEMGYEPFEARLGLRACDGQIERAINFIIERKEKLRQARKHSEKERRLDRKLAQKNDDKNWVNPRSVCTLMEMGYDRDLVVEALKQSKNDLPQALDILQTRSDELRRNLSPTNHADQDVLKQLEELGFNLDMARIALETSQNNVENAIDFLVRVLNDENELTQTIERVSATAPSTSTGSTTSLVTKILTRAQEEMESLKAYRRFNEGLTDNEEDYLDLPLLQEEQILNKYTKLLLDQ